MRRWSTTGMLDAGAGSDGIVYGVVGYPGSAKVNVYDGTVGSFKPGKLLVSPQAQVVKRGGVLHRRASTVGLLLPGAGAEHDLQARLRGTQPRVRDLHRKPARADHREPGHLADPARPLPDRVRHRRRRRRTKPHGPRLRFLQPAYERRHVRCQGSTITSTATQVASGTVGGHAWTLWSKHGEKGSAALENAGLVLDGKAYGLCPGFPNPAELEMVNPAMAPKASCSASAATAVRPPSRSVRGRSTHSTQAGSCSRRLLA